MNVDGGPGEIDVDPEWVARRLAEDPTAQLVDVREPYEREAGHIPGSRHIELQSLSSEAGSLDPTAAVILYCRLGSRSQMAAQALRASGFEAYSMGGGLVRWAAEGRGLEPKDGHVADH